VTAIPETNRIAVVTAVFVAPVVVETIRLVVARLVVVVVASL